MESFESFARQTGAVWPSTHELFTQYQVETAALAARGIAANDFDWGMSFVFRFDRDLPSTTMRDFLELAGALGAGLRTLGLETSVRVVPYYEVGSDYLVQAKPPYDGGYSAGHFGEFVEHGDCRPPDEFPRSWAQLVEAFVEGETRIEAGAPERTAVLRTVMHRTLIRPWSELFWANAEAPTWFLYRPNVGREDLAAWAQNG